MKPKFQEKLREIKHDKFPEKKEEPALYAVVGEQRILDLHSIKQAEDLAKQTNGKVWQIVREGTDVHFLFPI